MANAFDLKFSHSFEGIVWSTLADGGNQRLFVEIRNVHEKLVSFSALNLQNYQWLWKDVKLEEPWWVSLRAVAGDMLLLTVYTETDNPDKKSLVAYDVVKNQMAWWHNGFSVTDVNSLYVRGIDAKLPEKETILEVITGKTVPPADFHLGDSQNFRVIRPFQYEEGTAHFDTVKDFLHVRLGILPVDRIEYLEYEQLIMVSVFVKEPSLANYLYGFTAAGELLIAQKLGENLSGIGVDTFFVFSGHLIFVKNKTELTSYKIV